MPAIPLSFRGTCGSFVAVFILFMTKREQKTLSMRIRVQKAKNRLTGFLFGVLLVLLFFGNLLHRCGDVEKNPGPNGKNTRQSRLTSEGKVTSNDNVVLSSSPQPATTPKKMEPTLSDVMQILLSVQEDVKETKDVCAGLRHDISKLKEEVADLKKENCALKNDFNALSRKLESVERKNDDLENRTKRNNLILHGIQRDDQEKTWDDCEAKVKDVIKNKLKLPGEYQFDRVHRLSSKKDSPIIAKFTFFKDKDEILKARGALKGTNVFIGEDFSKTVRDMRKKLIPHLKAAKSAGKRATMVFDHLVIEGKKMFLNAEDNLLEIR